MSPRRPRKEIRGPIERTVAEAKRAQELRSVGYRDKALGLFPHICGRCGREFSGRRLKELTVHHKDHDHDNNPPDGSNWELLCIYCHDMEHMKYVDHDEYGDQETNDEIDRFSGHRPFEGLKDLLKKDE
jgi:hypothetical protein